MDPNRNLAVPCEANEKLFRVGLRTTALQVRMRELILARMVGVDEMARLTVVLVSHVLGTL